MNNLTFVVVGHPNEGKSSVVSTLTEKDIRISETSGLTEVATDYTVKVDDAVLTVVDTPGFQTAKMTHKWVEAEAGNAPVSDWVGRYITAHEKNLIFKHDIRILTRLADADAILYVVDPSKPIGRHDLAEMALLQKIGKPRIALFNSKKDDSEYLEEWQHAGVREFNAQYTFNALKAGLSDRIGLLETMKTVFPGERERLELIVEGLKTDWQRRLEKSAELIHDLLRDCLTKESRLPSDKEENKTELENQLRENLKQAIRELEAAAHKRIRKLYKYAHLKVKSGHCEISDEDLFSRESCKALGLSRKQLAVALAVSGAAVGALADLALGEISFGIFMAAGALTGGVSGMVGAKPLARGSVKMRLITLPLGKMSRVMRIRRVDQLPFLLVDRALLCHAGVTDRAHARQDEPNLEEAGIEGLQMTRDWPADDRAKLAAFCARQIKGRSRDKDSEALIDVLIGRMKCN